MKKRLVLLFVLIVGLLALVVPTVVLAHNQDISKTVFYACEASVASSDGTVHAGQIDSASITRNDALKCPVVGGSQDFDTVVQWNVQGIPGTNGTDGQPGPQGTQGTQGDTGPAGLTGSKGDTGPQGEQGIQGLKGDTGDIGPAGPQGDPGVQGSPGPKGDKGDPGSQGLTGPQGPIGPAGIPFSHAACSEKLSGSAQQENRIFCQSGIEADGGLVYTVAINAAKVHILVGTPIAALPSTDWSNLPITYVEFSSGSHMEYHADNIVRIYNTLNQRIF